MTRKDYELIAEAMREGFNRNKYTIDPQVYSDQCSVMADALSTTNPNFNQQKFLEACDV